MRRELVNRIWIKAITILWLTGRSRVLIVLLLRYVPTQDGLLVKEVMCGTSFI